MNKIGTDSSLRISYKTKVDGIIYILNVKLADDCNNKHCDFSFTGSARYEGEKEPFISGACVDEIIKYFPKYKKYVNLHLHSHEGMPLYPVGNGIYFFKYGVKDGCKYLNIDESIGAKFENAARLNDEQYFKYLLFKEGVVDSWKKEADELIKLLEEETGFTWKNPYNKDEERFRLEPLTSDEEAIIENRIKSGYYSPIRVRAREKRRKKELLKADAAEIKKDYSNRIKNIKDEYNYAIRIAKLGIRKVNFTVVKDDYLSVYPYPGDSTEKYVDYLNIIRKNIDSFPKIKTIVIEKTRFEIHVKLTVDEFKKFDFDTINLKPY